VQLTLQGDVDAQLDQVQPWDGSPLPSALRTRLKRAWQQGGFLTAHIQTLEAERRALLRRREAPVLAQVRPLFPDSARSQWYEHRCGAGSARLRTRGMVALARKLLSALWRFGKTGVLPEGAVLKTATPRREGRRSHICAGGTDRTVPRAWRTLVQMG